MSRLKTTPRRSIDQLDCEARLAKCARALEEPNWTGATHVIADRDGLFGRNTEVQFVATRKARPVIALCSCIGRSAERSSAGWSVRMATDGVCCVSRARIAASRSNSIARTGAAPFGL